METPLPAPTASAAKAPKPKCSPPSPEELCLRTFCACWYLDKDWLVSFMASAQCVKPDSPITWVEFMPKGHTHLVCSTLKLVPATKNLPLTKIKEVMFTFVLETLNGPGILPGFFNAHKAAKPRKRVHKRPGKETQPGDDAMAVTPPPPPAPSLPSVPGPRSPNPSGGGQGDPSSLGEEQGNWSYVQHLGDSSEKPTGILGSSSEEPDAFLNLNPHLRQHMMPQLVLRWPWAPTEVAASVAATSRAPSPSPLIASVLGKCSSPPPPTSPPPWSVPLSPRRRKTGVPR